MGQSNNGTLSNEKELTKMFTIQGRVKDHNLTYLEHNQTHKQYLLRETTFNQETDQLELLTKLKNRQGFSNPHLTNLIKYEQMKKEDMCSKYYRVYSLWEYPRRTLAEEINQRALAKQPFPPGEIRTLIKNIAEGMLTLEEQRIAHECLTSRTVLVEGPTTFRVVDPIAVPMQKNLDVVYHKRSVKNIYLSPEECRVIDQQNLNKEIDDPFRSDVYTAGMLVLEAGLLRRQDQCYEDDCSRVNNMRVQQNIGQFGQIYGPQLRGIVEMMLMRDVQPRIHWTQLLRELDIKPRQSMTRQPVQNRQSLPVTETVPREPIGRITASRVVEPKREETMRRSYVFNYRDARKQPPPINVQAQLPGQLQSNLVRNLLTQTPRNEPQRSLSPNYQPARPISQTPMSPNRITQVIMNQPDIVVRAPSSRQPAGVFHYPPPSTVTTMANPIRISEKRSNEKDPSTVNKTVVSAERSSPTNGYAVKVQAAPPLDQPEGVIEFDQNQPIYSIDEFKNGSKYEGYKFKGKREGWGKYTYQEGGCYEGEWKNDLMCGRGKLFYQSGKLAYEGYLENDLFHGTGTLYNEQPEKLTKSFDFRNFEDIDEFWMTYEGQFRQDKKEGQGKLTLSNGQTLQGSFHEDKVQGQGQFTTSEGVKIRGIWHENRFQRQI